MSTLISSQVPTDKELVKWAIPDLNRRHPPCKGEGTAKQTQAAQGLTATPELASPYASPCEGENRNAGDTESRQDETNEETGVPPVDLLATFAGTAAGLDLDRLAAELRKRLTKEQRRQLAELLD